MIKFYPLKGCHFPDLFEIEQREYPKEFRSPGYGPFCTAMLNMTGLTLTADGEIVGAIYFNLNNGEAVAHGFIDSEYQGRCWTRAFIHELHKIAFKDLGCHRVTVPLINGTLPKVEKLLIQIGFKHEGFFREGLQLEGKYYDIKYFGMLESDLRI